ncbi:chromosome segregation protein [Grosmannia clavigera kw1407]|uniref:Chromosome segregation protein n=1 Tax=Grosmannia clavigera (strain kw1407 / UAMH 11150) TaxID=655863 RepID=F0XA41_GROCL|nr:chromosome segregation protein [Grosmannia clavigera kw1407]EFX06066.1 chromosome segregation protein [Grosmannia clavigera kw1407]
MASRPRPRPAHIVGPTRCAYTPNGRQLVTVGANNTIRLYKTGFDGEPANVDDCQEQNVGVAATDDFFVVGSEDGTVSLYSLDTNSFERFLVRTSLPVRDVALSADGRWCAVASDELTVRVVGTEDNTVVRHLRAHSRPTKHVAFDPQGRTIALACTDGIIYSLESDAEATAHIAWHPDSRAFAVATPTRDIQVVSRNDWERQRVFSGGHEGEITALAWSPNGALLASAGRDGKMLLWETRTQSVVARHDYAGVQDIAWHPTNNLVSFTNGEGEVYICPDFVGPQYAALLRLPVQPSPFIHDPDKAVPNGHNRNRGHGLLDVDAAVDSGDEGLMSGLEGGSMAGGDDGLDEDDFGLDDDEDDGFVVDDDGAGYTATATVEATAMGRKRPHDGDPYDLQRSAKRPGGSGATNGRRGGAGASWPPRYHAAFQPGSTPWRGNRKYLCLNLVGVVWTVDQDAHHTVTVEFYDRDFQRDYHFTDTFLYDKACLNEHGTLFSCPPREDSTAGRRGGTPAMLFYRPHESWTQQRLDWRTALPAGETVVAMSLSASYVTVATSADYVRVYTLFGVPCRVFRPKSTPVVTCASWHDYVLTMGNGPAAPDGTARLQYTIQNVQRDEICQDDDTVALPAGVTVQSVFFSDDGDPCIYDSTGTLLTLLHWRQPSRASWVPLLDTRLLPRLASGRKHESYYPIAVADRRFHCIILKGGDKYPYFPRPLLSEFPFSVPLTSVPAGGKRGGGEDGNEDGEGSDENDDENENDTERTEEAESRRLEQTLVLHNLHAAQMASSSAASPSSLARLHLEADKTLLQLLALECRAGEERGMRAMDLVRLLRDGNGHLMEAAVKVAERYGRAVLGSKIREEAERRLARRVELEEDE